MEKNLIALSILGLMTSAASAASSITFYGKVEAAYQGSNTSNHAYNGPGVCPADAICIQGFPSYNSTSSQHAFTQGAEGESRIGIKGNEDLGNGTTAFFQLESKINGDTGSVSGSEFFGEKSIVGLSFGNGKHSVYFGRSASPIDRIGFSTDHLSSGLGWKSSEGNWKNAAFYDYSANGLSVMAGLTTKGGLNSNNYEGYSSHKPAYGVSAKYAGSNFAVAAGFQKDNGTANGTAVNSEWGVGAQYTFNPVTVSASYADAKLANSGSEKRIHATISAKLTANDTLFVNYLRDKTNKVPEVSIWTIPTATSKKVTHFGLGYIHTLSKRTELFANIGREKATASYQYGSFTLHEDSTHTAYDIGLRHSF